MTTLEEKFFEAIREPGEVAKVAACADITKDEMGKFSEWLSKGRWVKHDSLFGGGGEFEKWQRSYVSLQVPLTTSELIELFLNRE